MSCTQEQLQVLIGHIVTTLPEDLSARRRLLGAAIAVLPESPETGELRQSLDHLVKHELHQRELAFAFTQQTRGGAR